MTRRGRAAHMRSGLLNPSSSMIRLATLALALLAPALAHASSTTVKVGDLVIERAWTREAPPRARVAGGYLTVTNNGGQADRLVGGSAAFAGKVEIHEMAVVDGVMRMASIKDGLEIAPGATVELKPGGYHVMFMGLTEAPKAGGNVSVTLDFQRAGAVTLEMPVRPIGADGPVDHSKMKQD